MTDTEYLRLYRRSRRADVARARVTSWFKPELGYAADTLRQAKDDAARLALRNDGKASRVVPAHAPPIWSTSRGNHSLGAAFSVGAYTVQWCEAPAFRFVGLASDVGKLRTLGYFVDAYEDETARGVIYQMRPINGRARYVPAVADPYNSDRDGRGPAMLALADVVEADNSSEDAADDARREAARIADAIAEAYATREREWHEAHAAGVAAREKAGAALKAGRRWTALQREARNAFATRRARGVVGITLAETLAAFRELKDRLRAACDEYQDALETAREARELDSYTRRHYADAFAEGYANG